jgi:hypothetical protein
VDPTLGLAAVALGSGGVDVVNVADPTQPELAYSLPVFQAGATVVIDGRIFGATNGRFQSRSSTLLPATRYNRSPLARPRP